MSWTSHENREPGVEHKKNAESVEREQIGKHQHANGIKGGPTTPSRGSAYNTGGEIQRVLPADVERLNVQTGRSRTLSQKANQNAIQTTLSALTKERKTLKTTYETIEKALSAESLPKDFDIYLSNTKLSYTKYKGLLEELISLLKHG